MINVVAARWGVDMRRATAILAATALFSGCDQAESVPAEQAQADVTVGAQDVAIDTVSSADLLVGDSLVPDIQVGDVPVVVDTDPADAPVLDESTADNTTETEPDVPPDLSIDWGPPHTGERSLCDPCDATNDCKDTASFCVAFGKPAGSAGFFCAAACGPKGECPAGSFCDQISTSENTSSPVCVPESESCACSAKAASNKWSTPCYHIAYDDVGNKIGKCAGTWSCAGGGAACDAALPTAEICNGIDDNCDGKTDENVKCDDGDACTTGDACVDGKCKPTKDECGCKTDASCPQIPCGDKSFCNKAGMPWKCATVANTAIVCDAKKATACAVPMCDVKTGACALSALPDGKACDADGDACTAPDHCAAGLCKAGDKNACNDSNPCTFDDCDAKTGLCSHFAVGGACDDGNSCTASETCKGGKCQGGIAKDCNDNNACTVDSCDGVGGGCSHLGGNDGAACSDGDACTSGEVCGKGICGGGKATICDDNNPCTLDNCDSKIGCGTVVTGGKCDDGNPCTGGDFCAGGKCQPGVNQCACLVNSDCTNSGDKCSGNFVCNLAVTPHVCAQVPGSGVSCVGTTCTTSACDGKTGKCVVSNSADGKLCDDGNLCTANDNCKGGACTGFAAGCDDSNPCTVDSCKLGAGCTHAIGAGNCDDGSLCTTGDSCQGGVCQPGAATKCDDGNACTADSCDASNGVCKHITNAEGQVCIDGDGACGPATCKTGACKLLNANVCDDGNGCTGDSCKSGAGCVYVALTVPCDDANACTAGDVCAANKCTSGKAINCDDGNVCTDDSCAAKTGCAHLANTAGCSDNDACTIADACKGAVCLAGAVSPCDDGNSCSLDTCNAGICKSNIAAMEAKACPPSKDCNGDSTCTAGVCIDPPGTCPFRKGAEIWPPIFPKVFGPAKTLYDPVGWHVVNLTVAKSDWSAYLALVAQQSQAGVYFAADVAIDGAPYGKIGIRTFGFGSQFYNPKKPNIRMKFDQYDVLNRGPDKTHNLRLKASGQDRTWLRQPFSQTFVQQIGGYAPRYSWAHVIVNGVQYGIYQIFEQTDHRMFEVNFGNNDGGSFQRINTCVGLNCPGGICANLPKIYTYDGNPAQLVALAQAGAYGAAATWWAEAGAAADLTSLLAEYAVEAFEADIDSLAAAGQNFTMYLNQSNNKLEFIPTGQDLVLGNYGGGNYALATPWGAPNTWCVPRIDNFYTRIWNDVGAKQLLMAKFKALHCGPLAAVPLNAIIDGYHELLKQDLYFDPKGQATPAETDNNYNSLKAYVTARNAWIEPQVGICK